MRVDQIFVTTSDDKSPDALSIAFYAGEKNIQILFTESDHLSQSVKKFIRKTQFLSNYYWRDCTCLQSSGRRTWKSAQVKLLVYMAGIAIRQALPSLKIIMTRMMDKD